MIIHNINQSYEAFKNEALQKKIIIYGVGMYTGLAFDRLGGEYSFEAIVDGNKNKQNVKVCDLIAEASGQQYEKLLIASPDIVYNYDPKAVVIIVTSYNYYDEIAAQLNEKGYSDIFVLKLMEANSDSVSENKKDHEKEKKEYSKECLRFPVEKNKIVFSAFNTYSDHGKYITEELIRQNVDCDIVWIVGEKKNLSPRIRQIYASNWKECIYELETAKIWIYNMVVPDYLIKRDEQYYIQTKHWSSIVLKKTYLNSSTLADNAQKNNWIKNGEMIDYIISGSDIDEENSEKSFAFNKEFWRVGSPRTDAMFNCDVLKDKVCKEYNIKKSSHIVIYAPTYRYNRGADKFKHISNSVDIDYEMLKQELELKFGGEWIILLRLHPSVAKDAAHMCTSEFVINASDYDDSMELVAASDVMISDYSSIMFETAIINKPVFLFATDKEEYIGNEYDLLIDYDTLPFPMAASNDELRDRIHCFDQDTYESKVRDFWKRYGIYEDGRASERTVKKIVGLIN